MPIRRKYLWISAGIVALAVAASVGVAQTSKTEFCMSCHEMQAYKTELQASSHAKDAQGKEIGCAQCHIPGGNMVRMLAGKSWLGVRDVWEHFTGNPYSLDRAAMQPIARRFTDDANCLACHEDLGKNAKGDGPVSKEGRLAHDNYLGLNGQSRNGCAGCHANMAHLPVFDQRQPKNAKFLSRLKESGS